jgi:predicted nucleic acid-binding protein
MILLDTNVLSALMRQSPDTEVINWLPRAFLTYRCGNPNINHD